METKGKYDFLDWKILAIILLVLALLFSLEQCGSNLYNLKEKEALMESMEDTLKTWKDKDGNNKARISTLETTSAKDFINMKSKDAEIVRLQNLVKENKGKLSNGGSAIALTTEGKYTYKGGKPEVIFNKDRIDAFQYNPCDTIYPTYRDRFQSPGKWVWGDVTIGLQGTEINIAYRDSIDIVLGRDKTGFLGLGKGKPFGEVTSYNPYTAVKQFRTYNVKNAPKKRFGIGPTFSYGFGTGSLKPQFFIGVGGQYNLINF